MAAFDANAGPPLNKERSAFEEADGDLGSDEDEAGIGGIGAPG